MLLAAVAAVAAAAAVATAASCCSSTLAFPLLSVELGLLIGLRPLPRGRPKLRSDRGEPDSSSPLRKEPLEFPPGLRCETSELRLLRSIAVRISTVGVLGVPPAAAATACFGS